jgi:hypothetical protein
MNRWYFWVLAPIMLATAIGLPFITHPPTPMGTVVLYLLCGTLLAATLGLARPKRFQWALKLVAAAILLGYSSIVADELVEWWRGKPLSETNLSNAVTALFFYGVPCVYFIFKGRTNTSVDVLLDVEPEDPQ